MTPNINKSRAPHIAGGKRKLHARIDISIGGDVASGVACAARKRIQIAHGVALGSKVYLAGYIGAEVAELTVAKFVTPSAALQSPGIAGDSCGEGP